MQHPADWTKLKYANWLKEIQAQFKVGQLVTLNVVAPQENVIPFYWIVNSIEEVQAFCPWDRVAYEPEAILCERPRLGTLYRRAPSVLRPLTDEELRLVILQDTEPQGSA